MLAENCGTKLSKKASIFVDAFIYNNLTLVNYSFTKKYKENLI